MSTVTCKVPAKLNAELASLARRQRVTKPTIIRQALERYVQRSRAPASSSAFDFAKSLGGSRHGPPDLSTNLERLEGFGA